MTTGKTIALTRRTFVGKVMSLLFNMLSSLVITFFPRSKRLLISWLQSSSTVILEPRKIKSATVSTVSPSIYHEVMGLQVSRVDKWKRRKIGVWCRSSINYLTCPKSQLCHLTVRPRQTTHLSEPVSSSIEGGPWNPHGVPRWLSGRESACQCRRHRRPGFDPWVRKIPWRRKWWPTPVFLPGESHGQRILEDYSPWSHKNSDMI